MPNSPALGHNSDPKSSGVKFLIRMQACLLTACLCVAWLGVAPTQAAIGIVGNVVPTYPGGDPWNVGGKLFVAYTAPGSMSVDGGSDVTNSNGWIGYTGAGAVGTVEIQDPGSSWENTINLSLGSMSTGAVGHLEISGGATVYVGDAAKAGGTAGWLIVSDSDSSGTSGGRLSIYNGSTLSNHDDAVLGDEAGEYGWATVDGAGSAWTDNSYIFVGRYGSGTLDVQNGGTVSNYFGRVGYFSGSNGVVTVDGANSSWTNSNLYVGLYGSATLNVENGGNVFIDNDVSFGFYSSGTGSATVDGAGSTLETEGDLQLGRIGGGFGSLVMSNGGTVYIGDAAKTGGEPGVLTVSDADASGTDGGRLNIYNGSTLTHELAAIVGDEGGEYGWAVVDGAGSSWSSSQIVVGLEGTGSVTVQNGGEILTNTCRLGHSPGGTGTLTVDGTDSSFNNSNLITFGEVGGSGTLIVQNGGSASNTFCNIGHGYDGSGTATVDGAGSSWTNTTFRVGYYGSGSLTVQNGGSVISTDSCISYYTTATGTATVDGSGSTWESTQDLCLGDSSGGGTGTLVISDGGSVYVGDAAKAGGSSGSLIVSDSDAGGADGGQLEIYYGSSLTNEGHGVLGNQEDEYGWATVNGIGSSWSNGISLHVGYNGTGTLSVQNGGSVTSVYGYIGTYSTADGTATVDGAGSSWTSNMNLDVGRDGRGTLAITGGGLVKVPGTLTIDFNTDGDSQINMSTGGMLALFGEADDSLTQFLGLIDGTDAINYWDETNSDWADISGAMRCRDYMLELITSGDLDGYTLLTVRRAIDGDANGDGVVDVTDLGILATNYGAGGGFGWCGADFNGDGIVNVIDLGILATHYGETAATLAVPEPGMLALLVSCCPTLLGLRARRRKR